MWSWRPLVSEEPSSVVRSSQCIRCLTGPGCFSEKISTIPEPVERFGEFRIGDTGAEYKTRAS